MKSDGYLIPPSPREKDPAIWHETWKRVDRFLPGMRKEIFPDLLPPQHKQQQLPQQPKKQERGSVEQGRDGEKRVEAEGEKS